MHDYAEFPPLGSFKRVLQTKPETALLYASLWKMKPKSKRMTVKKNEIKKQFLISPTLFRNALLAIGRMDLISFQESEDLFLIDFYDSNEN